MEEPANRRCPGMSFLVRSLQAREWLWVDSNGDRKPTFSRRANQSWLSKICNHFAGIAAWSPKSLTTFAQMLTFLEKDPLRANFHKCFPIGFTISQIHVLCANIVKFGWPDIGNVVRYLPDKKNKISARSPVLAFARIEPKICQGQLQTIYSEYPNFIEIRSLPAEL